MTKKKNNYIVILVSIIAVFLIVTGIASWIISISNSFEPQFKNEWNIIASLDTTPVVYNGQGQLPSVVSGAPIDFNNEEIFSKYNFYYKSSDDNYFNWVKIDFDNNSYSSPTNYLNESSKRTSAPVNAGLYQLKYEEKNNEDNFAIIEEFIIEQAEVKIITTPSAVTLEYGVNTVVASGDTYATHKDYSDLKVNGEFTFVNVYLDCSGNSSTLSTSTSLQFTPIGDDAKNYKPTIVADVPVTLDAVAYTDTTYYSSIEFALQEVNSGEIYVVVDKNPNIYKSCEIKSGVTLNIPYEGKLVQADISGSQPYARDVEGYLKCNVTILTNVTLTVKGTLKIGGVTTGGNGGTTAGHTAGNYAQISMQKNSKIDCYGGIECFGYIIGEYGDNESNVIINDGASIKMPFIVHEHRGGSAFLNMAGGLSAVVNPKFETSPFNRFNFNNVEAALTIKSGGLLIGRANLFANNAHNITEINIIGVKDNSPLFSLDDGSYLVARYNHSTQIIDLDFYGGGTLGVLTLNLEIEYGITINVSLSTKGLLFPISWYYNITFNPSDDNALTVIDCTAQDVKILPGAIIKIEPNVKVVAGTWSAYTDMVVEEGTGLSYPSIYPYGGDIPAGKVIVNGQFEANSFGGLIETEAVGAKINIKSNNKVTSKEFTNSSPAYQTITEYLRIYLFKSNGVSSNPSVVAIGEYDSNVDKNNKYGWVIDPINISYDNNLGEGAIVYVEDISVRKDGVLVGAPFEEKYLPINYGIANPTRENYRFVGWSLNPDTYVNPLTSEEKMFANTVLYAIWEPVEYNITYITNKFYDGETEYPVTKNDIFLDTTDNTVYPKTYNVEGTYSLPSKPVLEGYQFAGWYTDSNCTDRITSISPGTFAGGDQIIYALWNPVGTTEFTLKFNVKLADGTEIEGSQFNPSVFDDVSISCFDIAGVEFDLSKIHSSMVNVNNDINSSTYLLKLQNPDGTAVNSNKILISENNTDSNGVYILTVVVKEKIEITYNNDSTKFYAIPSGESDENILSGTTKQYSLKSYFDNNLTVWFTTNAATSSNFYIASTDKKYSFANSTTLYAFEYIHITFSYTLEEATVKTTCATKVLNGSHVETTINDVSATSTTTTTKEYYLVKGASLNFEYSKNKNDWRKDPNPTSFTVVDGVSECQITAQSYDSCITADTLITLSNGTRKMVKDLLLTDIILVFNHQTGQFEASEIAIIDLHNNEDMLIEITKLYFANGTILKIIGKHNFYNVSQSRYVTLHPENAHEYIGDTFVCEENLQINFTELINVELYYEMTKAYSITSKGQITAFTNGILSAPPYTEVLLNIFDINNKTLMYENVEQDIIKYGLFEYSDVSHFVSYDMFVSYNAQYWKIAIGKGLITEEKLKYLIEIHNSLLGQNK